MFRPNSIILYVDNVDASTTFYKKILEKEPAETFDDFVLFVLGDTFALGLQSKRAITPNPQDSFGGFELCVNNATPEEVDTLFQTWKQQGIAIAQEPEDIGFGRTFVALDPDGHRLRVCATDTSNIT